MALDNMGAPDSPAKFNSEPAWSKDPKWKLWEFLIAGALLAGVVWVIGYGVGYFS